MNFALWFAVLFASSFSLASTIDWNVEKAVINGNGCQKDADSFISANGDDLAIVFTNLGIDLPGNSGQPLTKRKNCAIRVPADILAGFYIGQLTQMVTYGITKTERSQGNMAIRSKFFGFDVSPHDLDVPRGKKVNQPLATHNRSDRFAVNGHWHKGWCHAHRPRKGAYQAHIAVAGQRDSDREDLLMFIDGLDLKFELVSSMSRCER